MHNIMHTAFTRIGDKMDGEHMALCAAVESFRCAVATMHGQGAAADAQAAAEWMVSFRKSPQCAVVAFAVLKIPNSKSISFSSNSPILHYLNPDP